MVELVLSALDAELPPHCYAALRVGDAQKIGRVSSERMYKFDEKNVGEHKYAMLDVFQRIGGCTVSIKSKDGDQDVNVNTKTGKLNFRVSSAVKSSKKSQELARQEAPRMKAKADSKFEAAKSYLFKHNLEERLKNVMKEVINEMPDDPVDFITRKLRETDCMDAGDKPQPIMLQPEQLAFEPEKGARQFVENPGKVELCAIEKSTEPKPVDLERLRSKTREALCDATTSVPLPKRLAPEDNPRANSRQVPVGATSAELRQEVRQALLDANADGCLQTKIESVRLVPFPAYYTKHFRGNLVETLARKLFEHSGPSKETVPKNGLVLPPSALTEEEVEEFELQMEDLREDLTDDQILKCKSAFSEFENVADGTVAKESLGDVMRSLGHELTASELQDIMLELDMEGLRRITFPQLLSVEVERMKDEEAVQELIPAFRIFDHNGDGFVDCASIRRVMDGLGDEYTEAEVNEMIRKAGANGTELVNYAEFAKVMVARTTG